MERTFIPEIAVGFFQIDLTDANVHHLDVEWAAARLATPTLPDINARQYLLLLDCEGANTRYRADGVDPGATVGNRIIQDTQFVFTGASRTTLSFIQETAGAKLNVGVYAHVV